MSAEEDHLALLDDYLSGAMSNEHASSFEESLFAEAATGHAPELAYLDQFFDHTLWFTTRGGFPSSANAALIEELRALPHTHHVDLRAETHIPEWPADTELVVYRLDVDLRGYENIDVAITTPEGVHRKWFRDVQFDPADGAIYGVCDAPVARGTFRLEPLLIRVHAAQNGQRSVVAELRIIPQ